MKKLFWLYVLVDVKFILSKNGALRLIEERTIYFSKVIEKKYITTIFDSTQFYSMEIIKIITFIL